MNPILMPGILFSIQFRNSIRFPLSGVFYVVPLAIALAARLEAAVAKFKLEQAPAAPSRGCSP